MDVQNLTIQITTKNNRLVSIKNENINFDYFHIKKDQKPYISFIYSGNITNDQYKTMKDKLTEISEKILDKLTEIYEKDFRIIN